MSEMLHRLIEDAVIFGVTSHRGQFDKSGRPYLLHFLRILSNIQPDPGMPEATFIKGQILSVLHDVYEDCDVSLDEIEQRFGLEIAEAVNAISRRKNETYVEYLERVKRNELALFVKKWDIKDNMSHDRNGPYRRMGVDNWSMKTVEKYRRALNYLNNFTKEF